MRYDPDMAINSMAEELNRLQAELEAARQQNYDDRMAQAEALGAAYRELEAARDTLTVETASRERADGLVEKWFERCMNSEGERDEARAELASLREELAAARIELDLVDDAILKARVGAGSLPDNYELAIFDAIRTPDLSLTAQTQTANRVAALVRSWLSPRPDTEEPDARESSSAGSPVVPAAAEKLCFSCGHPAESHDDDPDVFCGDCTDCLPSRPAPSVSPTEEKPS